MMKRLTILFLLTIVAFHFCNAQVSIANVGSNFVYAGIENQLKIAVYGFECKNVDVKVDKGEIKKIKDKCGEYIYTTNDSGEVKFTIWGVKNKNIVVVEVINYKIKPLPQPYAYLGAKHGGNIQIIVFKEQIGITANVNEFVVPDYHFKIDSFSYAVIRNDKLLSWGKNKGELFEQSTKDNFDRVIVGDTISFYNIYYRNSIGESEKLEPFEMYITK